MSDYTPFPAWPAPEGGGGGGVTSHGALTGRSSADQHPIGAITGLEAALASAGGGITAVSYVVTGNVTVSSFEALLTGIGVVPAGTTAVLGVTGLVSTGGGMPTFYMKGTVTGGDPGLYEWDGTNLNFVRALAVDENIAPGFAVDASLVIQGQYGPFAKVISADLGGGPELIIGTVATLSSAVVYDNATSGLTATDVQAALDEVVAQGESNVVVVNSTVTFDVDGMFDLETTPQESPPGFLVAVVGQDTNPDWNGVWDGTYDGVTPSPLVKARDLDDGVIVTEYVSYNTDTLASPVAGGHVLAKGEGTSTLTGQPVGGDIPTSDGWALIAGSLISQQLAESAAELVRQWPDYFESGDNTIDDDVAGQVLALDGSVEADVTLTMPAFADAPGLALDQHFNIHNDSDTYKLIIEGDTGVQFRIHAADVSAFEVLPGGWATAWNITTDTWVITGDGFAYVHNGTDYVPTFGVRTFIGPDDPEDDGFTLVDGDQWKDTSA